MIDSLQDMVFERIIDWYNANGALPKNILYYRDGVSDGQYAQVKDYETQQIRKAYDDFSEQYGSGKGKGKGKGRQSDDPKPPGVKLTAVICTKRHHTRFYPTKDADKQANGNQNCKPGTIVERGVTHRKMIFTRNDRTTLTPSSLLYRLLLAIAQRSQGHREASVLLGVGEWNGYAYPRPAASGRHPSTLFPRLYHADLK
jgi:hypothetical protein